MNKECCPGFVISYLGMIETRKTPTCPQCEMQMHFLEEGDDIQLPDQTIIITEDNMLDYVVCKGCGFLAMLTD